MVLSLLSFSEAVFVLYSILTLHSSVGITACKAQDFVLGNEVIVAVDGVLEGRSGYCELESSTLVVRILEHTVNQTTGERVTTTTRSMIGLIS